MTAPVERSLLLAFPWLVGGVLVAPLGLLFGPAGPEPTTRLLVHLAWLVLIGLLIADRLAPLLAGAAWFSSTGWPALPRFFAAAAVLVIVPTGVVGLVTLASAAALRFDPSLQFLQLLSALDIVWAGSALLYGVRLLRGRGAALAAAFVLGVLCVASLGNYVRVVGYGPEGAWLVDGTRLMTLVIPFDTAAALVGLATLAAGGRRLVAQAADQRIEQDSDQS